MIETVVAASDPLVALGLKAALEASDDIRVVALVDDVSELVPVVETHDPDVVVLDVAYRRADPTLIPGLMELRPGCKVLVIVDHSADDCPVRDLIANGERLRLSPDAMRMLDECCLTSLRGMARGCVPSESTAEEVRLAVRTANAGDIAAAPWLTAVARSAAGPAAPLDHGAITARELEIIGLLAEGLGNKQIAKKLSLREQTVKNHLARIMTKVGIHSRLQLGLAAKEYGLKVVHED